MRRFAGAIVALPFLAAAVFAQEADTIFSEAEIVTMNPDQPQAQAVAVKDGVILAVGNTDQVVAAHKGTDTQVVDVAGKTLLPGFIDPHSHFINALGMSVQANVSAPPVGPASNPTEIVAELKRYFDGKPRGADQQFMGYG